MGWSAYDVLTRASRMSSGIGAHVEAVVVETTNLPLHCTGTPHKSLTLVHRWPYAETWVGGVVEHFGEE